MLHRAFLGELLPLVYGLQARPEGEASKLLRKIRAGLDAWEDMLPPWLRPAAADPESPVSGASSLHLGFLALRMLVARLDYQVVNTAAADDDPENLAAKRYFQTECRKAAEEIVHFMVSLQKPHYREFWLTYSAYHLTSAATLLVRCALETTDPKIARQCMTKVDLLRDTLRAARAEHDWDLADMCLDHCEKLFSKSSLGANGLPAAAAASERDGLGGPSCSTLKAGGGGGGPDGFAADAGQSPSMGYLGRPHDDVAGTYSTPAGALLDASAIVFPETLTHNEIVDDMMSISNTFGALNGLPFDMAGVWGYSGLGNGSNY
ncbi:hypothetical protein KEM52_002388 [Ascosphaera acerosa]|nr:hypothetical protein KEM52_002388 [Ascosphaera acerosa]